MWRFSKMANRVYQAAALGFAMILGAHVATGFAYISPGAPAGYVNDFAGALTPGDRAAIETTLKDFHEKTGGEIVVAVVPSVSGESIEGYANTLFREWGVGSRERNDGVLLLVSMKERMVRIEVGYGYEGMLTDAQSSRIIRDVIIPRMREGAYGKGVFDGVNAIIVTLSGKAPPEFVEPSPVFTAASLSEKWGWVFVCLAFLLALSAFFFPRNRPFIRVLSGFIIGSMLATGFGLAFFWGGFAVGLFFAVLTAMKSTLFINSNGISWRSGSGGGFSGRGGFGGFGGGSSGGGGATGRW